MIRNKTVNTWHNSRTRDSKAVFVNGDLTDKYAGHLAQERAQRPNNLLTISDFIV